MKTYLVIFFLMLMGLIGIGVVTAGIEVNAARNYHADVISEIECSNFNLNVVNACKIQAKNKGYQLVVTDMVYDIEKNQRMAEVVLSFQYAIPILNLISEHEVRGFAR